VTEQIVGPSVDDLLRGQEEDIARLGMLVAAAGRLFGTLDLDAVLPEVLELAQATLESDAYALWLRDANGSWSLQAASGLSDGYVAAASEAIKDNETDVPLDRPLVAADIAATDWLTDDHKAAHEAEGNRSFLALPLEHQGNVVGTLVFYSRSLRTFEESEIREASVVAGLAAAAVGMAGVYNEQARLAESRRLIAEASEQLASAISRRQIGRASCRERV